MPHEPTEPTPPHEPEAPPLPAALRAWLRYRMLARLWWLVSPVAVLLLVREPAWLHAAGITDRLAAVRLEQWIAVGLLLLHAWFLWRGRGPEP